MLHPPHHDGVVDQLVAANVAAPVRPRAYCMLGPGERVINGRVYYSAAWLCALFEPEVGKAVPKPAHSLGRRHPTVRPGLGG